MSAQIECPICMDCVEFSKNCVTTECGHSFHASCLMQNVAHNGFGCPYCRTAMADEPEEDEETVSSYEEDEEDEDQELIEEDILRGFRLFFNNINGAPHEEEDIAEENLYQEELVSNNAAITNTNVPSIAYVAQKLQAQGVTYEKLIHMICNLDHEEYTDAQAADRFSDELFGKIRIITSNYEVQPSDVPVVVAPVLISRTHDIETASRATTTIDLESQPKTRHVRNVPTFMSHV